MESTERSGDWVRWDSGSAEPVCRLILYPRLARALPDPLILFVDEAIVDLVASLPGAGPGLFSGTPLARVPAGLLCRLDAGVPSQYGRGGSFDALGKCVV